MALYAAVMTARTLRCFLVQSQFFFKLLKEFLPTRLLKVTGEECDGFFHSNDFEGSAALNFSLNHRHYADSRTTPLEPSHVVGVSKLFYS